ncbi:MAG: hypothetical protein V6Z81_06455 [Parvularculales bacterium]
MELQTHLKAIETAYNDLIAKHEAEIEALKAEHADRLSAIDAVLPMSMLDTIVSEARAADIGINTFLLETVIQGLKEKKRHYVPVSLRTYETLMSLARGRGIDLKTLTERDSFLEYIERGVQMGAF